MHFLKIFFTFFAVIKAFLVLPIMHCGTSKIQNLHTELQKAENLKSYKQNPSNNTKYLICDCYLKLQRGNYVPTHHRNSRVLVVH